MHLHCVHLAIIYSVSAKPLVLVCLGEDRKLFLPLRYSIAQVMLTTLLEYRSHSSSPCSTCKHAPFPGYVIWKDYVLRTISYSPSCIFWLYISYLYQAKSMSDYCSHSGLQIILRSDSNMWFFKFVGVTVVYSHYFYFILLLQIYHDAATLGSLLHFPAQKYTTVG